LSRDRREPLPVALEQEAHQSPSTERRLPANSIDTDRLLNPSDAESRARSAATRARHDVVREHPCSHAHGCRAVGGHDFRRRLQQTPRTSTASRLLVPDFDRSPLAKRPPRQRP
jgi:hypothetical protein